MIKIALNIAASASIVGLAFFANSCQAKSVFNTNLVVNGDAESGPGGSSNIKSAVVPGWITTGNFSVIQYGASGGFPDQTSPGPAKRGKNFFYGGPDTPGSSAKQWINLKDDSKLISTGTVNYTLSGYLGGFESQADNAVLIADFKSSDGKILKHIVVGPDTPGDRKGTTRFLFHSITGQVPQDSAGVMVKIVTTRYEGSADDGYSDDISLVLTKKH